MTSEWFACLIRYIFCPAQILLEQHLIEVKLGKTADTRPSKNQTLVVLLLKQRRHILSLKNPVSVFDVLKGMFQFSTGCRTVHRLLIPQSVSVLCVSEHTHVQNCTQYEI